VEKQTIHPTGGRELVRALVEAGPVFVRLGQQLWQHAEMVSPAARRDLLLLKEPRAPLEWSALRPVVDAELGPSWTAEVASVEPQPLRSTFLYQAHGALLRDGSRVEIRVRRPGVRREISAATSEAGVRSLASHPAVSRQLESPSSSLRLLGEELVEQVDFDLELRHRSISSRETAGEIRAEPVEALCGSRVLTLRRVEAAPLVELLESAAVDDSELSDDLRSRVADALVQSTLTRMLVAGGCLRFLHPENFGFSRDGKILVRDEWSILLDGDSSERASALLYEVLTGSPHGLLDQIAREVEGVEPLSADLRRRFLSAARRWEVGRSESPADAGQGTPWPSRSLLRTEGLLEFVAAEQLPVSPESASVLRALAATDRLAWLVDGRSGLERSASGVLAGTALRKAVRSLTPHELLGLSLNLIALVREAPQHLSRLLRDLAEERFTVRTVTTEAESTRADQDRRTRLLAAAIVSVGLAALVATPQSLVLFGLPLRVPLGLALAGLYAWIGYRGIRGS